MRYIAFCMVAVFILSVSFSESARASMPCCEEMSKATQAEMPCHDTGQKKAPVQQHAGCNDCACLHCPTTTGALFPGITLTQHTLSMSYFVIPKQLNSHTRDVFYPPPKSYS